MGKISVVINTFDEEVNLPRALESIKDFASEIVVVDMYSTDKTAEIARAAGAKVFMHKQTSYVEPARNFAISKARGDWVLVLDADEVLPKTLAKKLVELSEKEDVQYWRVPRKNIIFGRWIEHSRWWPDYNIRFFRRGFVKWGDIIHSTPTTRGKGLDLEAIQENAIIHYNYDSVEQYLDRLGRYTSFFAKNKLEEGYRFVWPDLLRKPFAEFISRYFEGKGYKDGLHGLVLSLLQAFSEFVVYVKLWQADKFTSQPIYISDIDKHFKVMEKEFKWWITDAKIENSEPALGWLLKLKRRIFFK